MNKEEKTTAATKTSYSSGKIQKCNKDKTKQPSAARKSNPPISIGNERYEMATGKIGNHLLKKEHRASLTPRPSSLIEDDTQGLLQQVMESKQKVKAMEAIIAKRKTQMAELRTTLKNLLRICHPSDHEEIQQCLYWIEKKWEMYRNNPIQME